MRHARNDFDTQKAIATGKAVVAKGVNLAKKKMGISSPAPAPAPPPPPPPKPKKRDMIGSAIKKAGSGVARAGGSIGRSVSGGGKAIGRELKARSMAKQATAADENFVKHATGFNQQRAARKKAGIGLANARKAASVPDAQLAKTERQMAKAQAKLHKNAMRSIQQSHLDQARRSLRGDSLSLLREDAPRRKVGGKCGKGWQDGGPDGKCIRAKSKFSPTYGQRGKGIGGTAKWLAKNAVLGSGDVEYNRRRSLGQDRKEAFVHGYGSGVKGGIQNLALGGPVGGSVYRRSRDAGQSRWRSGAKGVGTNIAVNAAVGAAAMTALNALSKTPGRRGGEVINGELINPSTAQESKVLGASKSAGLLPGGRDPGMIRSRPAPASLGGSRVAGLLPGGRDQGDPSPTPKKRKPKAMMRPRPETVAGREALSRIAVKKMIDGSKKRGDSYLDMGVRRKLRNDSFELARTW